MAPTPASPAITSFVIRFVHPENAPGESISAGQPQASGFQRGTVRHVQSDQELTFTNWADAVAFMNLYVRLHGEE